MQAVDTVEIEKIDPTRRYRFGDVAKILGKTTQNIGYLHKKKYFKETRVVGGTPINKRIAVKGQSIIDFVESRQN